MADITGDGEITKDIISQICLEKTGAVTWHRQAMRSEREALRASGLLRMSACGHYIINLLGEDRCFRVAKEKRFALQGFSGCPLVDIIS